MKQIHTIVKFGTHEIRVPVGHFESVAEAIKDAGNEERVLRAIHEAEFPRSAASSLVVKVTQDLTKVPFLVVGRKDGKGHISKVRDMSKDSNLNYVQRALKAVPAVTAEAVSAECAKRSNLRISLSPAPKAGPRLGSRYVAIANALLDGRKS